MLHEARNANDFRKQFETLTGRAVERVIDGMVAPETPRALFLVGSHTQGMATTVSDVDFILLVDSKDALLSQATAAANTEQRLIFSNDGNALVAASFVTLTEGIAVEVQVAVIPAIENVYNRLRRRGPELSESEIMTLGRLSMGWLLSETEGYLERSGVVLQNPALDVYCCTRHFVSALIFRRKAMKAHELEDLTLALHLGRSSAEVAYLSYFASEGLSYLGAKWPAQIGGARGASERLSRHPLLKEGIPLLFPTNNSSAEETGDYLRRVSAFLNAMRKLIEHKVRFRIAFSACPQIFPL